MSQFQKNVLDTPAQFKLAARVAAPELTRREIEVLTLVATGKTNKEISLKVLQKYTRVNDPEILEATYTEYLDYIESIPYVSKKGMEIILGELAEKEPKARQARPEDFLDTRFLDELEREGLFKKLWGR